MDESRVEGCREISGGMDRFTRSQEIAYRRALLVQIRGYFLKEAFLSTCIHPLRHRFQSKLISSFPLSLAFHSLDLIDLKI